MSKYPTKNYVWENFAYNYNIFNNLVAATKLLPTFWPTQKPCAKYDAVLQLSGEGPPVTSQNVSKATLCRFLSMSAPDCEKLSQYLIPFVKYNCQFTEFVAKCPV